MIRLNRTFWTNPAQNYIPLITFAWATRHGNNRKNYAFCSNAQWSFWPTTCICLILICFETRRFKQLLLVAEKKVFVCSMWSSTRVTVWKLFCRLIETRRSTPLHTYNTCLTANHLFIRGGAFFLMEQNFSLYEKNYFII